MEFHPQFSENLVFDLLRRLRERRLSDAVTDDWRYGTERNFLISILDYWEHRYDFGAAIARLDKLPQFLVEINGFPTHYVLLKSNSPSPKPLLLMNGWPSSFIEYIKLAPRLANPSAHGGRAEDAFDVVIPALPGFGFSGKPTRPFAIDPVELFHELMTKHLGYSQFYASGTDIGAGVATRLALKYPNAMRGIHVASVVDPPLAANARGLSADEMAYQSREKRWDEEEGAYQNLQSTRPQTLAFALSESPSGLASWILEKFYFWSDHKASLFDAFSPDVLIDNLMVYWMTESIGSSMRYYYDARHYRPALQVGDFVNVPVAICMWPKDLIVAPRDWCERFYNVKQYTLQPHGGHFPAWERPDAYADDLTSFVRTVETARQE